MSNIATLTEVAVQDAASKFTGSLNLDNIGEAEARKIMSLEHKALGYRPPPGSLASEAQAAAAKHPQGGNEQPNMDILKKAALEDAAKIERERGHPAPKSTVVDGIDLGVIGEADARKLMSEEHKALGYRPPPGSLAADAQSAAAKHPEGKASIDPAVLTQAALKDAARISSERRSSSGSPPRMEPQELSQDETRILQSLETKLLDSTKDTISAEAQSVNDKKDSKEAIPSPEATAETTEATTTDQ